MRKQKQKLILEIIESGRYRVYLDQVLYKRGVTWLPMAGTTFDSGYRQITLCPTNNLRVTAYVHQIIYLAHFGQYSENQQIDHIDGNNKNNMPMNLASKTSLENAANSRGRQKTKLRLIRSDQIAQIRQLHSIGGSQNGIAKILNLNRLSVRYIVKRIEAGEKLKYEL